jgi:hypothetical protein
MKLTKMNDAIRGQGGWVAPKKTKPEVSHCQPQKSENSGAIFQGLRRERSCRALMVVAGVLLWCACLQAFTVYDHQIAGGNLGPPADNGIHYSSIIANPNDHWSWTASGGTITITYWFDSSFNGSFNAADLNDVKNQVIRAMKQWESASSTPYGSIDSYARRNVPPFSKQFMDIRSATLHELGHILGMGHCDDQGSVNNYAYFTSGLRGQGAVGSGLPAQYTDNLTGREVMSTRSIYDHFPGRLSGEIYHILSWDELDGFHFLYGTTTLKFQPAASEPAANLVFLGADLAANQYVVCAGVPSGQLRNVGVPTQGTEIYHATITYNRKCTLPVGFRTLGYNFDCKLSSSLPASRATAKAVIAIEGTDNPTLYGLWMNYGTPYVFTTVGAANPNGADDKDYQEFTFSGLPTPIPVGTQFHPGLQLDVWDWTILPLFCYSFDSLNRGLQLPTVGGHEFDSDRFYGKSPAPTSSKRPGDTYSGSNGMRLTTVPATNNPVGASGFMLTSWLDGTVVSDLKMADVTGMGLTISNLNRAGLNQLATNGLVLSVSNFAAHTLNQGDQFVVVLSGDINYLPPAVRTNGNYLLLNRPDLVGRTLMVSTTSSNSTAVVGNFNFVAEPPVLMQSQPPVLSIAHGTNSTVTVSWTGTGILVCSTNILGPWADVTNAISPYTIDAADPSRFYRVRVP